MLQNLKHRLVLWAKSLIYGRRGEAYSVMGQRLYFVPGTRPVRLKYRNSSNSIVRYDALQIEHLCACLGAGDFAMDIGTHAGQHALIMAMLCGEKGRVIAFEPDVHARKLLAQNIALNRNIAPPRVEVMALSDHNGMATFFSNGGDANSSLSLSGLSPAMDKQFERMEVPVIRFDDYMRDNALPMPKFVKIDTEGAEIRILQGAESLLASDAEIVCELHPYAWEGFGNSLDDLTSIIAKFGRHMRYLDQAEPVVGEPVYGVVVLERE